jgi:hypothetical protein
MKSSVSISLDRKTIKRLDAMGKLTGMDLEVLVSGIIERALDSLVEVKTVRKQVPAPIAVTRVKGPTMASQRKSAFDMRGSTVSANLGRKILEVLDASSESLTMTEICHLGEIDPSHVSYIKEIMIAMQLMVQDGTGPSFHNRANSKKWRLGHLGKRFITSWLKR